MIHPYEITIGSLLRTNKGEIIRVESISTKRQHRKVGYHTPDDPYRIKYVRLAQCEGIELTPEILEKNGFETFEGKYALKHYRFLTPTDGVYLEPMKIQSRLGNRWYWFSNTNRDSEVVKPRIVKPLVYVHQLQFVLINAELHELAMKFIVWAHANHE